MDILHLTLIYWVAIWVKCLWLNVVKNLNYKFIVINLALSITDRQMDGMRFRTLTHHRKDQKVPLRPNTKYRRLLMTLKPSFLIPSLLQMNNQILHPGSTLSESRQLLHITQHHIKNPQRIYVTILTSLRGITFLRQRQLSITKQNQAYNLSNKLQPALQYSN